MPFLKLYPPFARPEFYQPPNWRYCREGTRGQNPKPKNAELAEGAKTLTSPAFGAEEQKGKGQSAEASRKAQPGAAKKRLLPAGRATG